MDVKAWCLTLKHKPAESLHAGWKKCNIEEIQKLVRYYDYQIKLDERGVARIEGIRNA
jgi:hypothetical protein